MGYDIYIADYKKTKILKLPIIPTELPAISRTIKNEEFETYDNGTFNFIEKAGLNTLTLDSWLPTKDYYFAKSSYKANDFITLLNTAIDNTESIQVVILNTNGSTYINDKFSIESFQYHVNKRGDYAYSLGLKQYRETTSKVYVLGWNQDATGWWYCTSVENYTWYSDSWQQIDGAWYYFNKDGYAIQSQWLLWKNVWYYLDENCKMVHNCWKWIDGKCYYFYDSGAMASNCYTPDGYWVDSNGAWVQ